MEKKASGFLGTYFNKDAVLKLSLASKILAWVVLAFHLSQMLISIGVIILQIVRGFWVGMGTTDIVQNFIYAMATPLHGVVYFFALLGISQILLMFMDIEENTRRAARDAEQKP
jgi:hypothetical protein